MNSVLALFLSSVLVSTAIFDIRVQKIPNLLTYLTMAAALIFHSFTNGVGGFIFGIEGLALGIGLLLVPYLVGVMGAGDAKLMGAVGAALGPGGVFYAALLSAIAGGLYALIVLLAHFTFFRGLVKRYAMTIKTLFLTGQLVLTPASKNEPQPKLYYGVAIALGTLAYVCFELTGYDFFN
jgi:prepilin peptidase CpaA